MASCDRIEAALARIARAAGAIRAKPDMDQDLLRRHAVLRDAATQSLAVIDALIAANQPDERLPDTGE